MADKNKQKQDIPEAEPLTGVSYKKGEYVAHILIEQTRALKNPASPEKTIDPLIQLECFGQKKFSTQKKGAGGTSTTVWNEHFYFTAKFQDGRQLQNQEINLKILDHRLFGSDAIVGLYEFDFSTIYMMDDHVLLHKWLGLVNPEKDFNQITGFLKVSINIVAEGDRQTTLCVENDIEVKGKMDSQNPQSMFSEGSLLLPPHIQTKGSQLRITLAKGNHFMKMDSLLGTIDPFVVFEFGGLEIKTEQINKAQNPIWEFSILLPVMIPSASDHLMMRLYDYDFGSKDEIVGCQMFKISDIQRGALVQPQWYNIYGAHIDAAADQRAYLCSHPDLGTCWAGRIMAGFEIYDEENPKRLIEKIIDQKTLSKIREEKSTVWQAQCLVYFAMNLPNDTQYGIKLKWGEYESKSETHKAKNGLCEFYQYLNIQDVKFPCSTSAELPDLFMYLTDDDKPICFKRWQILDVLTNNQNPDGRDYTVTLIPDKSVKNTPMDQTGIVKVHISVSQTGVQQKLLQVSKPKNQYNSRLFVNLFQAQNLNPTDMDGLADPVMDIVFYDLKVSTQVINDTICPIWNQQLMLTSYNFEQNAFPPIILRLFDQDRVSRDFMGQTVVDFNHGLKKGYILRNANQIAKPTWIDVLLYGQKAGKILISLNYNDDASMTIPKQINPKTIKHFMKIKILGLRNLKSFGPVPVTKAFIKFNLQSIRQPNDTKVLDQNEIITQPKEAGSNPNIQSIIVLDVMLPQDESYMPMLAGSVHDYIFKGILQPLIGQFQIDLRHQKLQTLQNIQTKLALAQKILTNTLNLGDNMLHLPAIQKKLSKEGSILDRTLPQEKQDEDCIDLLTELGILKGDSIDMDKIIRYVQYRKIEDEGTFEEVEKVHSAFIPLGYDTQLQKANLYMIRQQRMGNAIPSKDNATSKARMQVELKKQFKSDKLAKIAGLMMKQDQIKEKPSDQIELQIVEPNKQQQEDLVGSVENLQEEKSRKHYRLCIPCPLEDSVFMTKNTFDIYHLRKGIKSLREVESMADLVFGKQENELITGKVKGWFDIISQQDLEKLRMHPAAKLLPNELDYTSGKSTTNQSDKELVVKSAINLRIYILDCFNLPNKDADSMSDPYIKIKLGDQVFDNKDEHINDDSNPSFYKIFDITTNLPGPSDLLIQVFDFDDFLPDELIGQTTIDLEERFFQTRFRQLKQIPIETRQLFHPSSSVSQGVLRMFMEMIPAKQTSLLRNPWFIAQRPKVKYVVRVVVWDVFDVPTMDIEGTSDIYVAGYLEENHKQLTDTHYRSKNGKGSFNWRMIFPIELPQAETIISFQIFDKDIFSPDDFISDCSYDITPLVQKAFENEINLKLLSDKPPPSDGILGGSQHDLYKKGINGIQYEKVIIPTENVQKEGYNATQSGSIVISLEIMPEEMHSKNLVGLGRSQPNHSPVCPEPTGRIEWSWNPFKMLDQLLGPKAKLYLLLAICFLFTGYMLIMYVPIISGNIVGNLVS